MFCPQHPLYKGLNKPVDCKACRLIWRLSGKAGKLTEIEKDFKAYLESTSGDWYTPKIGQRIPESCGMYSDAKPYYPGTPVEFEVWSTALHSEEVPQIAQWLQESDAKFVARAHNRFMKYLNFTKDVAQATDIKTVKALVKKLEEEEK